MWRAVMTSRGEGGGEGGAKAKVGSAAPGGGGRGAVMTSIKCAGRGGEKEADVRIACDALRLGAVGAEPGGRGGGEEPGPEGGRGGGAGGGGAEF